MTRSPIGETGIIKLGRGIVHFPHCYFVFTLQCPPAAGKPCDEV